MSDEADNANDDLERAYTRGIKHIRQQAKNMPEGTSGECALCGEESKRLVSGNCAPCRDKYKLR